MREMVSHLERENIDSQVKKEYFHIDQEETAARRRKKRKELKRKGCMKFCLMAVNQLGQWMVREVLDIDDDNIVSLKFDEPENCYDTNDIEYADIPEDEYEYCRELLEGDMVLPVVCEVFLPRLKISL